MALQPVRTKSVFRTEVRMLWKVEGADAKTGSDVAITVSAATELDAIKAAKARGLFVSSVREEPLSMKSRPGPSTPLVTPTRAILVAAVLIAGALGSVITIRAVLLPPPAKPSAEPDPVASFRSFSGRLLPSLQAEFSKHGRLTQVGGLEQRIWIGSDLQIDVKKTESLVSPFLGVVRVPDEEHSWLPTIGDNVLHNYFVLTFALQGDKWVLTSAVSELHNGFDVKSYDMVAKPADWGEQLQIIQRAVALTDAHR